MVSIDSKIPDLDLHGRSRSIARLPPGLSNNSKAKVRISASNPKSAITVVEAKYIATTLHISRSH